MQHSCCQIDWVPGSGDPSVFEYREYRRYLADFYESRKRSKYGFSYRQFAALAGFRSPNYLKRVTSGERDLTPEMASRFARACGLEGERASYFCDLVYFNQASSAHERQRGYEQLRRYRAYRKTFRLDAAHAAYHAHWYIPAIRELASARAFRGDPAWIARQLTPRISPREAGQALSVLEQLGLLEQRDGHWVQPAQLIETQEGPLGHHIKEFHRAMMTRAAESLDTVERTEREFGALTLCVSEKRMASLQEELFRLRERLLHESADDSEPNRVVQVNFQLFPLTRVLEDSDES